MKKTVWKLLPKIFGDQFKITEAEAIQILQESIYSKHWKHGPAGAAGVMWRDKYILELFKFVLLDEDVLVRKVGRAKVQKELFYHSKPFEEFIIAAGLKYKRNKFGYLNFKNDYSKWKRLKFFKPTWKKGKITEKKLLKRLKARNKKIDDLEIAESKQRTEGLDYTAKLIRAGKYEYTPFGLRKIPD